jgi:hypothetical protein
LKKVSKNPLYKLWVQSEKPKDIRVLQQHRDGRRRVTAKLKVRLDSLVMLYALGAWSSTVKYTLAKPSLRPTRMITPLFSPRVLGGIHAFCF